MGLRIIPRCVTDDAVLTSTPAAAPGLGADNLQLSDRGLVWRVLANSAELTVNLPAARRAGGVVLWRHQLTSSSTWRVRIYEGADYTGALQYDSGTVQAVPPKALGDLDWGIDPLGAPIDGSDYSYVLLDADVVARSIRIDLADPDATEIEVGRLFAGPVIRPTYGFGWGLSLAWERETRRTRTAAGGLRIEADAAYRVMKLGLEWITDPERTAWADLLRDTGNGRELWISARTGNGGRLEADNAMLGALIGNPPLVREQGLRYTASLEIEEA